MIALRHITPREWVTVVESNIDAFLQDHAANERKVSQSALTLAVQHHDRPELVDTLVDIAREELEHFRRVYDLLRSRGKTLGQDAPDPYMTELRRSLRRADHQAYLLDRLVLFAVVEARGHERFTLLAENLGDESLRRFYASLGAAEARHHATYLRLAQSYFDAAAVDARLDHLLTIEATTARQLPLAPRLH